MVRRWKALRRVGLKLRMPSRTKVDFIRFTKGQVQDRRRPKRTVTEF